MLIFHVLFDVFWPTCWPMVVLLWPAVLWHLVPLLAHQHFNRFQRDHELPWQLRPHLTFGNPFGCKTRGIIAGGGYVKSSCPLYLARACFSAMCKTDIHWNSAKAFIDTWCSLALGGCGVFRLQEDWTKWNVLQRSAKQAEAKHPS